MAKGEKQRNKIRVLSDEALKPYIVDLEKKGYRYQGYLGTGNWGEVYRFTQESLDCDRAVKILLPQYRDDKVVLKGFLGEAEKITRLSHNHIVNIFDVGTQALPYYVMEFVDSEHLGEFLEKNTDLSVEEHLQILNQICDVLVYIHTNKVVHLDIKKENILVKRDLSAEGIKLADFGLAHYLDGSSGTPYPFNPDQYFVPPSLEGQQGKQIPRSAFKPSHDLFYFGKMLSLIPYEKYVTDKFSERQIRILELIVGDLCAENYESAEELAKQLEKLSPTHPPTAGIRELAAARAVDSRETIRIPPQVIVPTTRRLRKLIDLPELQRLRRIRQLGPTSLIYPGGSHSRLEHALGAYAMAVEYLTHLLGDPEFDYIFNKQQLTALLVAVLVHDIGHYPFAHQLEELNEPRLTNHRDTACDMLCGKMTLPDRGKKPKLAKVVSNEFGVAPEFVAKLIKPTYSEVHLSMQEEVLASFLDGAIDVDKQDYLSRDAHHLGVEYAKHIDKVRLLRSLTISKEKNQLAVTEKGKVAAEFMIMSRSAMFSEVYWHHTNRAATAMIQRAFQEMVKLHKPKREGLLAALFKMSDEEMLTYLVKKGPTWAHELIPSPPPWSLRKVYKRLATFAIHYGGHKKRIYDGLIKLDYKSARTLEKAIYKKLSKKHPQLQIEPYEILLDIPTGEEKIPPVQIVYPNTPDRVEISLKEITHFSDTIFDDFFKHTKKARVFCHPRLRCAIQEDTPLILDTIADHVNVAIPANSRCPHR